MLNLDRPILTRPTGCKLCGKPLGLVGDRLPADELCPWCRGAADPETPGVNRLWETDRAAPKKGRLRRLGEAMVEWLLGRRGEPTWYREALDPRYRRGPEAAILPPAAAPASPPETPQEPDGLKVGQVWQSRDKRWPRRFEVASFTASYIIPTKGRQVARHRLRHYSLVQDS